MCPRLVPLDNEGVDPLLDEALREREDRAKQITFRPAAHSPMSRPDGMLPAKKTNGHLSRMTTPPAA